MNNTVYVFDLDRPNALDVLRPVLSELFDARQAEAAKCRRGRFLVIDASQTFNGEPAATVEYFDSEDAAFAGLESIMQRSSWPELDLATWAEPDLRARINANSELRREQAERQRIIDRILAAR